VTAYEDYYYQRVTFALQANKETYDLVTDVGLIDGSGNPTFLKVLPRGSVSGLSRRLIDGLLGSRATARPQRQGLRRLRGALRASLTPRPHGSKGWLCLRGCAGPSRGVA